MTHEANRDAFLHRRALAMAQKFEVRRPVEPGIDVIEFALGYERYAIQTTEVDEVCPFRELTPLPGAPPHITGIVNIRGRILAVVDLKKFFGLAEKGIADLHEIIIVKTDRMELGILADFVAGSRFIPEYQLAAPQAESDARNGYVRGVTPERILVLDLRRLLDDPRMIVNEEVT